MAQLVTRTRSDGGVTHQVKWRLGGRRDAPWQSESFTSDVRAAAFKLDVEEADHQWPTGWVKGHGYAPVDEAPAPVVTTFGDVAESYWRVQERRVKRGHVKPYTLQRDKRAVELHMANLATRDFTTLTTDDLNDWVDAQLDDGAAAKSIRNRHGLLAPIMDHGAYQLHLRPDNPCRFTDLPAVSAKNRRQVRFFLHAEWGLMRACLKPVESARVVYR